MDLKIERVIMSGHGPKYTYCIKQNGEILFKTSSNSYRAWTRKKDAQKVVDAIQTRGLEYVNQKLNMAKSNQK